MSNRRSFEGDETYKELRGWIKEQKASERLAGHILASAGYISIDPSHPLGGKDGLKDLICSKNGMKYIAAAYFPKEVKSFNEIYKKFKKDSEGGIKNNVNGFVFVTNQKLTVGEREKLVAKCPVEDCDIFHLERITHLLNEPKNYGVRLEFLDIEMSKEEQLSFFAKFTEEFSLWGDKLNSLRKLIEKKDINQSVFDTLDQLEHRLFGISQIMPFTGLSQSISDTSEQLSIIEDRLNDLQGGYSISEFSFKLDEAAEMLKSINKQSEELESNYNIRSVDFDIERVSEKMEIILEQINRIQSISSIDFLAYELEKSEARIDRILSSINDLDNMAVLNQLNYKLELVLNKTEEAKTGVFNLDSGELLEYESNLDRILSKIEKVDHAKRNLEL